MSNLEQRGTFKLLPYMGVIHVVAEAEKLGFYNGNPDWCNLGQGQPEVGEMEGAPKRYSQINIPPEDHAYGPIHGTIELRTKVADYYNRLYRKDKKSKYTAENVAIASGGRLALTRACFTLGDVNLGYRTPDYTAYEDMLGAHTPRITPIETPMSDENGFELTPSMFANAIDEQNLKGFLLSNPCNPTGQVTKGDDLKAWVDTARDKDCTLILDEFYSHFIFDGDKPGNAGISAASYIEDVNVDPVILVDGLTKNFRYPGWRVGWVVAPKSMIECMITSGSSVDGGPSRVIQGAAIGVLENDRCDQELDALRKRFSAKRNIMVNGLKELGIRFSGEVDSTFYAWGCLDQLPEGFNDGQSFFRKALEHKVMTVPGEYFDVNPNKSRTGESPYRQWMRFSFGPTEENMVEGLKRLGEMLKA